MDPERWERVKEVFAAVLEQPAELRDSFIEESGGSDGELKAEVRRLLAEHALAGGFLSEPPVPRPPPEGPRPPELADFTVLSDRFRILRFIARGGMGEVYEAEDLELGGRIALKTIRADLAQAGRSLDLFRSEIQSARKVTHPNVCRIFDVARHVTAGTDGSGTPVHFLTMELLEGQTLSKHLRIHGAFERDAALDLAGQMAAALRAAHDAGVIHRDFKPGNVILVPRGAVGGFRAVVTDFGLALPARTSSGERSERSPRGGTPGYMAPEQIEGGTTTTATDVYAFGLVAADLVGGGPLATRAERGEPPEAGAAAEAYLRLPKSCADWKPVLARCLETEPERRFQSPAEVVEALHPPAAGNRAARWRRAVGVAVLVAAVAFAIQPMLPDRYRVWPGGRLETRSALNFKARDWLLVTSFQNNTGEKQLEEEIEYALQRELSNSRYAYVVPRSRIEDTLRLLRKPQESRVDAGLGREVCLRDREIRALLTGRIEKSGGRYLLSASIVDPVRSLTVVSTSAEAPVASGIPEAVRRISAWAREHLGEAVESIRKDEQALERVSTPSLEAYRLYSIADDAAARGQSTVEPVLHAALALDPQFASAEILLAWVLHNQGRPDSEWRPHAERALQLSDSCTERERYFIRGSYNHLLGRFDEGRVQYEELVRLYPDHFWGTSNLAYLSADQGDVERAARLWAACAALRPNGMSYQARPADLALRLNGDMEAARRAARRILELFPPREDENPSPIEMSQFQWADSMAFHDHWQAGRLQEAQGELHRIVREAEGRRKRWRDDSIMLAAFLCLSLGELSEARKLLASVPDYPEGHRSCISEPMLLAYASEDTGLLRFRVRCYLEDPQPYLGFEWPVLMFLRAGLIDRTEALIGDLANPDLGSKGWRIARGDIAITRGETEEGIRLLREAVGERMWAWYPQYFMGVETLARALERTGRRDEAIGLLEEASRAKSRAYGLFSGHNGFFWLRTQEQLVRAYRAAGRSTDAEAAERELRQMLSLADHDHPILVRLNRGG